ncbi:hypothetical protein U1Q18_023758 [Sarracenia purpurea var. burkii]
MGHHRGPLALVGRQDKLILDGNNRFVSNLSGQSSAHPPPSKAFSTLPLEALDGHFGEFNLSTSSLASVIILIPIFALCALELRLVVFVDARPDSNSTPARARVASRSMESSSFSTSRISSDHKKTSTLKPVH